jgi:hypothetical protein
MQGDWSVGLWGSSANGAIGWRYKVSADLNRAICECVAMMMKEKGNG